MFVLVFSKIMYKFIEFSIQHWQLCLAFAVIAMALIGLELYIRYTGARGLSPQEATLLLNREGALVLDLRDVKQFAASSISGSRNIPLQQLGNELQKIKTHKNKPIIINYTSGQSYQTAARTLRKSGFTQIYHLKGGINSWYDAGFPLTK